MLTYVNPFGEPISEAAIQSRKAEAYQESLRQKRANANSPESYHKGWRVTGVRVVDLEEARRQAKDLARIAKSLGQIPKPFVDEEWIAGARGKPVRAKPYNLCEAAEVCAKLAEKSGAWLRVRIEEIKKG